MECPPFQVDDRVLCHQENGDTYEGVVRNAKYDLPLDSGAVTTNAAANGGRWSFFIHYNGWNARHDKWVAADRILLKKQQQHGDFAQQQQQQNRKRTLSDVDEDDDSDDNNNNDIENDNRHGQQPPPQRPRKKRVLPSTTTGDQQLTLPFTLKTVLVEEMECITMRHYLHQLPAAVPIRKVLNHLRKKHRHDDNNDIHAVEAFCQNLIDLFQQALPKCLLYTQEQTQFANWSNSTNNDQPKSSWVDVCGCEYLLRLVVQLPASHLLLTMNGTTNTNHYWTELLVLMQKNKAALFPTTLVSAARPHANYYYQPHHHAT
jgi:mortality factor 4-like protein 1